MNMARSLLIICFSYFTCLFVINCYPQQYTRTSLEISDKDCTIENDTKLSSILQKYGCAVSVPAYYEKYFERRAYLPCFGIYDALYRLSCINKVVDIPAKLQESFTTPDFCEKASEIYRKINFSYYKDDKMLKWSDSLSKTMTSPTVCKNTCTGVDYLDERCSFMLAASIEYFKNLEPKETQNAPVEDDKSKANPPLDIPIVNENIPDHLDKITLANVSSSEPDHMIPVPITAKIENGSSNKNEMKSKTENIRNKAPTVVANPDNNPSPPQSVQNSQDITKSGQNPPDLSLSALNPDTIATTEIRQNNEDKKENKTPEIKKEDNSNTKSVPSNQEQPEENEGMEDETKLENTDRSEKKLTGNEDDPNEGLKTGDNEKPSEDYKPVQVADHADSPWPNEYVENEESYTFPYFGTVFMLCCVAFSIYHYKNKLFALALEGRKGRSMRSRGRPSSANYSKLHSNLEEAIASNATTPSATHVLY